MSDRALPAPDPRRRIPRTDDLLADPRFRSALERAGREQVVRIVQQMQQRARAGHISPEQVADEALAAVPRSATTLRPVLNASGVVLHTNLGRAPLSSAAIEAVTLAGGYVDVELDVEVGDRATRGRGAVAALQRAVPDAGAVHVVNNGAAALLLATTALAAGREVVVSRGELVEIGDGFRLPDLIESTGARLREVGTTNRTHLADYAAAVGPDTGCVLKVHPSNFRVQGFTSEVGVRALAGLGAPVVVDIGSGLLAPDPLLPDEPDARTALQAGAAVVTASGDKLLGGPQAGLLLGEAGVVELLRRHPMARSLRVDKLRLAALEATLAGPATPTSAALRADPDRLHARCVAVVESVRAVEADIEVAVVPSVGAVGGGGAPGLGLPGWAVALPARFAEPLRRGRPCVLGRVEHGRCLLDLRAVPEADDAVVTTAVRAVVRERG